MANPRAFISFDFDHDADAKRLFAGQATSSSPTPFTVEDWSSKDSLPQAQWEALIAQKMKSVNLMIVLIGPHTYKAAGVIKEIQMARKENVPFFGVYVNGATSATPIPADMNRKSVTTWTWSSIASLIKQCMSLGKNK